MTKLEWWNYKDEIRIVMLEWSRMMKLKLVSKNREIEYWNGEIIIYCRLILEW